MKQFLLTMAGVFAGLLLFFVGLPLFLIVAASGAPKPLANAAVLDLDLRQNLSDQDAQSPFAGFRGGGLSVMRIITTLHTAESDDRVKAVLIRLPDAGMSPAAADEIRLAIKRFRKSGKPVFAHTQGLYPAGISTSTYELGAAADQLWMQPGAFFQAAGVSSEDLFFKRLFDKYGVKPEYEQRYEYKNAVNPYLYSDYTPAHKESELSWMGSIYHAAIDAAARDRHQDPKAFTAAVEGAPYDADTARAKGLIDRVGQVRDAERDLLRRAGSGAKLIDFDDYASNIRRGVRPGRSPAQIAVIDAEGDIVTGTNKNGSPFGGQQTIYSDDLADRIYDAIDDRDIKAIVIRLNSPGGADTASEQILAAVRAAVAAKKPVVVSMGTYGASGGYWMSSQASAIVAEPTTLTGSIGVFGGKFALSDTLAKFGVDARETTVGGSYASAYSTQPFTPEQRAAFAHTIDVVYDGFITRVASGRHLPPDRVRQIARGRVWTGAQAHALGLVDELGGFYEAVDKARQLAGLTGEVRLKEFTGELSFWDAIGRMFGIGADSAQTLATIHAVLADPNARAIAGEAREMQLRSQGGGLVLAPRPFG
jgi:protease-4